jgi:phenylpropionate dioxygenase-like ring-hydroxylating dioxygenase large terminal subunit
MTAVPRYASGIDFTTPAVRKDAFDVMARLVEHYRATSTDMVESQWREPVRNYRDPELWEREVQAIHRTRPLPVALSCELPTPGSYKAVEVVGTPLILTRDRDGEVRAMVNSCRHRGGEIVPEGTGHTRRFTCPYHAWSYDLSGCLTGVYGENTFGPVERDGMGLRTLPVGERAGIVFVCLTPGGELDLDGWLEPQLLELLEALDLADCFHHSTRQLEGPNWKVVVDGYLEGYHFASLHRTTVFRTNLSNMAAFDSWGPHQRNAFALRPIAEAVDTPPESWDPRRCVGAIYWLFPGLAIAGGWREQVAVSFVFPGRTWDSSKTEQHILLRREPLDDEERKNADHTRDWFHDVVLDEDYGAGFGVQRGLAAMADQEFVFGRNEPGVQHFHRAIEEQLS